MLHNYAARRVEDDIRVALNLVPPFAQIGIVAELHLAVIALERIEPDIAGIGGAVVHEPEIVIVLGGIDLHAVGKAVEDESEDGHRVDDRKRGRPRGLLDIGLVGVQTRVLGALCQGGRG